MTRFLLLFFAGAIILACDRGVGCPADQYNDWKKIEAAHKQQLKSPGNPNKPKGKKGSHVEGNGIVPK